MALFPRSPFDETLFIVNAGLVGAGEGGAPPGPTDPLELMGG